MRYGRLIMVTILVTVMFFLVLGACRMCSAEEPTARTKNVVVANETNTTITAFFIGTNGNRGTEIPPRFVLVVPVNHEHNALEVKAIAYRKDGSFAGMTTRILHPGEKWVVKEYDL